LVCEPCNNKAGSNFESSLIEFLNQQSFNINFPKSTVKSEAVLKYKNDTILPGKYKVKVIRENDGSMCIEWGNSIQPYEIQWMENLNTKTNDWTLDLTFKNPDYIKASQALVKAAYFIVFVYGVTSLLFQIVAIK
jgi:hypothetical protein